MTRLALQAADATFVLLLMLALVLSLQLLIPAIFSWWESRRLRTKSRQEQQRSAPPAEKSDKP